MLWGFCYPQYWLQGDIEDNFDYHLELIKYHYFFEQHLEHIKILDASTQRP
jgi:hypothetical protein